MSVLIGIALSGIALTAVLAVFRGQDRVSRQLAGNGGISSLSQSLDNLFQNPHCASMGTGQFLNAGVSPVQVALSGTGTCQGLNPQPPYCLALDTINYNGSIALTSTPDQVFRTWINPYQLGIQFTGLGGQDHTQFPFLMTVTFTLAPPLTDAPPTPLQKYVSIHTNDSLDVVGACYGAAMDGVAVGGWFAPATSHCAAINNPLTNQQTCPGGFRTQDFGAVLCNSADPAPQPITLCIGDAYASGAMSLGGWYVTASSHCSAVDNPFTGSTSCPAGFSAHKMGSGLCDPSDSAPRDIYICEATSSTSSRLTVGGWYFYPSDYCPTINDPWTAIPSCPAGFSAQALGRFLCDPSDSVGRSLFLCTR